MYFYDFIPTYKTFQFFSFYQSTFFWPEMDLSFSALPRALKEQNQINLPSPSFFFFLPCQTARKLTYKSDLLQYSYSTSSPLPFLPFQLSSLLRANIAAIKSLVSVGQDGDAQAGFSIAAENWGCPEMFLCQAGVALVQPWLLMAVGAAGPPPARPGLGLSGCLVLLPLVSGCPQIMFLSGRLCRWPLETQGGE